MVQLGARVAWWSGAIGVALTIPAIALLAGGCGATPKGPTPLATSDRTMLPRLNVYPGEPVVVALSEPWTGAGPLAIAEDGTPLTAELRRVLVEVPQAAQPEGVRADQWLAPPGRWRTEAGASGARLDLPLALRGRDAVLVAISPELDGRLVRIAGSDMVANVLPLEAQLPRVEAGSTLDDPWRPVLGGAELSDLDLLARVRIEAQSPLTRWRYRLLVDGLDPAAAESPGTLAPPAFEDASIELLAVQNERRWRVGLARLWAASADLASRVRHRLAAVVDFGGVRAPAWPTDHTRMDDLLGSLLDDRLTPVQVAQRAARWLEEMPPASAWVVDDAGVLPASGGRPLPTLGIVNFADRVTLAWAEWDEASAGEGSVLPEPRTLPPRSAVLSVLGGQTRGKTPRAVAHVGEWSVSLPVFAELRATPPGLTMAPFSPDHAMDSWQRGEVRQLRAEWSTAAILQRVPASASAPPGWEVLVECRTPEGFSVRERVGEGADAGSERIELWFGEPGPRARGVIVHDDGRVERRPEPIRIDGESEVAPERLRPTRTPGGWSVRIPLPAGLVASTQASEAATTAATATAPEAAASRRTLRMGLVRVDALGRRSAWPRPMLPWQEQPGRALIDVAAWDD